MALFTGCNQGTPLAVNTALRVAKACFMTGGRVSAFNTVSTVLWMSVESLVILLFAVMTPCAMATRLLMQKNLTMQSIRIAFLELAIWEVPAKRTMPVFLQVLFSFSTLWSRLPEVTE